MYEHTARAAKPDASAVLYLWTRQCGLLHGHLGCGGEHPVTEPLRHSHKQKLERTAPLDIVNTPVIGIEFAGASKKMQKRARRSKKDCHIRSLLSGDVS
jgi:hypothetical protein